MLNVDKHFFYTFTQNRVYINKELPLELSDSSSLGDICIRGSQTLPPETQKTDLVSPRDPN